MCSEDMQLSCGHFRAAEQFLWQPSLNSICVLMSVTQRPYHTEQPSQAGGVVQPKIMQKLNQKFKPVYEQTAAEVAAGTKMSKVRLPST